MSMPNSRRAGVLAVTALAVSAFALTGCKSSGDSNKSKSASSMQQQRAITASNRPSSRDMTTAVKGQTFTVELPTSNGSEYCWRLAPESADDKFVSLQELKQQQSQTSDLPGSPASDTFTFRANRTGKTTLTFVYDRPWNNNTAPRMFTLDVDVYKNSRDMAQANAESSMEQ